MQSDPYSDREPLPVAGPLMGHPADPAVADTTVDLEEIAAELADVEVALARLASGSYFTDEVTGEQLPDEVLADRPTARRATRAS